MRRGGITQPDEPGAQVVQREVDQIDDALLVLQVGEERAERLEVIELGLAGVSFGLVPGQVLRQHGVRIGERTVRSSLTGHPARGRADRSSTAGEGARQRGTRRHAGVVRGHGETSVSCMERLA